MKTKEEKILKLRRKMAKRMAKASGKLRRDMDKLRRWGEKTP